MKKVTAIGLAAGMAIVLGLAGFWAVAEPGSVQAEGRCDVGTKVVGLTAAASSISLPAGVDTGDITVSLDTEAGLEGCLDLSSATGTLLWPVVADFPLLHSLGREPLKLVLVGPFFADPDPGRHFLIAFDIGFVDDPQFGPLFVANNNKNQKNIYPILVMACGERPTVGGPFVDIDTATFNALERDRLRGMMDDAMVSLRAFDPTVPELPSEVLDTFFHMYESDPSTELIMYFAATDTYRTSQLTGTDELGTVCLPVGGTTELLVGGPESPAQAAEGSGSSAAPYGPIAGAVAAAVVALAAGGWYARRRFSKG